MSSASDKGHKGAISSSTKTWVVTAVLAVVIIGGAFAVSRKNEPAVPVPARGPLHVASKNITEQAPVAAAPVTSAAPAAANDSWKQAIVQPPLAQQDVPAAEQPESQPSTAPIQDNEGPAVLFLDHLAGTLKLKVPVLSSKENRLPLDYTCYRANNSPPLLWEGVPAETKSFVIFLEKRKEGEMPQVIWAIFNVPGSMRGLEKDLPKQDELENGIRHAMSDQDTAEYTGPCEPRGKIGYAFRLFALDAVLAVSPRVSKDDLIRAMNGHIIDAAEKPFIHYLRF